MIMAMIMVRLIRFILGMLVASLTLCFVLGPMF
jgi:hypothetical protein